VPSEPEPDIQPKASHAGEENVTEFEAASVMTEHGLLDEVISCSDTEASADAAITEGQDPLIDDQTVEDESDLACSTLKDTSIQPSELVFHAQVYCAALKLGIPCLALLAKHRCIKRLFSKDMGDDELLDAVPKVFRPEVLFVPAIEIAAYEGFALDSQFADIQKQTVRLVTRRFPKIKKNAKFEEAVITCPEFGRDVLRLL